MLTVLATIVVLSVLILVHEFGHFFAAKSVDISVPRFSLGLGPRVAGFRIGETEYVLSALPLGGYVKMAGMEEEEVAGLEGGSADTPVDPARSFDAKPLWARAWVISAGVIMNFGFAFLLYAVIGAVYGETLLPTTRLAVPEAADLPAGARALATVPPGAEIIAIDGEATENWNAVRDALADAPAGPVTLRFADAQPVTIRLPAGDSARVALLGAVQPEFDPVLGEVVPDGAAAEAGLRRGDRILRSGGVPVRSWQQFVRQVEAHPGQPLPLEVRRAGRSLLVTVTPTAERDAGAERAIGRIGVYSDIPTTHRSLGIGEAIGMGAEQTWENSARIVTFLGRLLSGDESPRSVGSLITIGEVSGQVARLGLESFLDFMAFFSINLAVMNLLPIPVLDGGHLLFLGIEAVRGGPFRWSSGSACRTWG